MTPLKPYRLVPIEDCGEPLVAIPLDVFPVMKPHPYQALGAPYGEKSPFFVRQGVRDRLITAQHGLQHQRPGWKILIFDAFRPLPVQQFMVDYTFTQLVQQQGLELAALTATQRQQILEQVYEFWALPDPDPNCPPPHSTGGAIDVTLVDDQGQTVDMGGAIDEISPRSYPNHYASNPDPSAQQFHCQRELLHQAMTQAGFRQHPNEWWHFCYGDQLWAWLRHQQNRDRPLVAQYGRVLEEGK
jgi:D-alanyl-D-alanine dipeptidase